MVNIATMGLFNPSIGVGVPAAGGIIHVPEKKEKPNIKILKITSLEEDSKKKIEVISVTGD